MAFGAGGAFVAFRLRRRALLRGDVLLGRRGRRRDFRRGFGLEGGGALNKTWREVRRGRAGRAERGDVCGFHRLAP